jgi:hypothetical protein
MWFTNNIACFKLSDEKKKEKEKEKRKEGQKN